MTTLWQRAGNFTSLDTLRMANMVQVCKCIKEAYIERLTYDPLDVDQYNYWLTYIDPIINNVAGAWNYDELIKNGMYLGMRRPGDTKIETLLTKAYLASQYWAFHTLDGWLIEDNWTALKNQTQGLTNPYWGANGFNQSPYYLTIPIWTQESILEHFGVEALGNFMERMKPITKEFFKYAHDIHQLLGTRFLQQGWIEFLQVEGGINGITFSRLHDVRQPADTELWVWSHGLTPHIADGWTKVKQYAYTETIPGTYTVSFPTISEHPDLTVLSAVISDFKNVWKYYPVS
jgi:hypothetical protein